MITTPQKIRAIGNATALYWHRLQRQHGLDDEALLCTALAACYHLAARSGLPSRELVRRMTAFLESLATNDTTHNRAELSQLESVLAPLQGPG